MKRILLLLLIAFSLGARAQTAPAWTWARALTSAASSTSNSLATDAAGNTYVAGSFSEPLTLAPGAVLTSAAGRDGFVAKYDPAGALLWSRQLSGSSNEIFQQVVTDAAGNVTLVGLASDGAELSGTPFVSAAFGPALLLARLNAQGQVLFVREVGGGFFLFPYALALDAADNCYISGAFSIEATFDTITLETPIIGTDIAIDQFLVKVSPQGTPLWARQGGRFTTPANGATFQFSPNTLNVEPGGNAYLTWTCSSDAGGFGPLPIPAGFGDYDVVVVKYNPQGTPQWLQRAGGTGADIATNTALDANGRLVVPGFVSAAATFGSQSLPATGTTTGYLWVLDPATGATAWVRGLSGGPGTAYRGVTSDAAGNIYAAGHFTGQATAGPTTLTSAGGFDGLVASYSPAGMLRWTRQTGGTGDETPVFISLDGTNGLSVVGFLGGDGLFGAAAISSQIPTPGNLFVARLGSVVTATRAGQGVAPLALYPNPAATTGTVALPSLPPGTRLTLTDALGRVTRRPAGTMLPLAGLAPGLYLVQATAPNGQRWTSRLTVE